jgi:hypothetical protein
MHGENYFGDQLLQMDETIVASEASEAPFGSKTACSFA